MTTTTEDEEKSNTVKAIIFVVVFFGLALVVLFFGRNKGQNLQNNNQPVQSAKQINSIAEFNKSDKSVEINGNILVAMAKAPGISGTSPDVFEKKNASELTKSPYSSIGKLIKIKGKVFKVEELPVNPGIPGNWAELLVLTPNKNSAIEVSTISFLYNGDISSINSGDMVTCSGYFAGTYQSQNAMGGTVEGLSVVGNQIFR